MTHLAISLIIVWSAGLLVRVGRALNFTRPASLIELGGQYQEGAIRNDWIMLVRALGGFVLLVWAFS